MLTQAGSNLHFCLFHSLPSLSLLLPLLLPLPPFPPPFILSLPPSLPPSPSLHLARGKRCYISSIQYEYSITHISSWWSSWCSQVSPTTIHWTVHNKLQQTYIYKQFLQFIIPIQRDFVAHSIATSILRYSVINYCCSQRVLVLNVSDPKPNKEGGWVKTILEKSILLKNITGIFRSFWSISDQICA